VDASSISQLLSAYCDARSRFHWDVVVRSQVRSDSKRQNEAGPTPPASPGVNSENGFETRDHLSMSPPESGVPATLRDRFQDLQNEPSSGSSSSFNPNGKVASSKVSWMEFRISSINPGSSTSGTYSDIPKFPVQWCCRQLQHQGFESLLPELVETLPLFPSGVNFLLFRFWSPFIQAVCLKRRAIPRLKILRTPVCVKVCFAATERAQRLPRRVLCNAFHGVGVRG
jgi:hypothetical protein